jgi:hypothetical protein
MYEGRPLTKTATAVVLIDVVRTTMRRNQHDGRDGEHGTGEAGV